MAVDYQHREAHLEPSCFEDSLDNSSDSWVGAEAVEDNNRQEGKAVQQAAEGCRQVGEEAFDNFPSRVQL